MKRSTRLLSLLLFLLLSLGLSAQPALVNINKADAAALSQCLTGIGPAKAEAIVEYRKKHGSFKSIAELKKVSGIGDKTVANNKKYLSLSKGMVKGDPKKYAEAKKAAAKSKKSTKSTKKK